MELQGVFHTVLLHKLNVSKSAINGLLSQQYRSWFKNIIAAEMSIV